MTDEQIVKALECCANDGLVEISEKQSEKAYIAETQDVLCDGAYQRRPNREIAMARDAQAESMKEYAESLGMRVSEADYYRGIDDRKKHVVMQALIKEIAEG